MTDDNTDPTGADPTGADPTSADPTVPVGDAERVVREYADRTVALLGNATVGTPAGRPDWQPCDHDGSPRSYHAIAIAQLRIPAGQSATTLRRVRERWCDQGYRITAERTFADGRGDLSAVNPSDGYSLSLSAGEHDTILVLMVGSPCLRSPVPLS